MWLYRFFCSFLWWLQSSVCSATDTRGQCIEKNENVMRCETQWIVLALARRSIVKWGGRCGELLAVDRLTPDGAICLN